MEMGRTFTFQIHGFRVYWERFEDKRSQNHEKRRSL